VRRREIMTNKEIAKNITDIVFDNSKNVLDDKAIAVKTLIEFLNSPSKYASGAGYHREDMESAIMDLLKDIRLNYVHYMGLSEKKVL
jgi:hypothetical protein